jgi:hydroxyethylthiazole kinase-like uncharacterized protein yjeF
MRPVGTAAEVRALDAALIDGLGLPGVAVMEQAARGAADVIRAHHADAARRGVVVVCGPGNNGGDGWGVARWLAGWGFPVAVWPVAQSWTGDANVLRGVAKKAGVREVDGLGDAGLVVDAVFGTGLTRPVEGRYADVLRAIDAHPAPVVALDLPSGLCADTGAALGFAVRATTTVTFGWFKRGLFAGVGRERRGALHLVDIGLGVVEKPAGAALIEASDVAGWWPRRGVTAHKGTSGHLLVCAGSEAMAGAAVLACQGALAAGAGLVTLATPRAALVRLGSLPPEVMVAVSGDATFDAPPDAVFARATAIVAGPGLGDVGEGGRAFLSALWAADPRPVLFDADALPFAVGGGPGPRLVTPHPGEAARMLGVTTADVEADRFGAVSRLSVGRVALLKGANTLVDETGRPTAIIGAGDPVLATGGSGDVLAGVAGALLARGLGAFDAARAAAWVHGRAGERLAGREGIRASDVAAEVPEVVRELLGAESIFGAKASASR